VAPQLAAELAKHAQVKHIKIEDGPGKPLGRSFRVKLWPTLVFLRDGAVLEQVARPDSQRIHAGFEALTGENAAPEKPKPEAPAKFELG
jgi:thioredoxin 1